MADTAKQKPGYTQAAPPNADDVSRRHVAHFFVLPSSDAPAGTPCKRCGHGWGHAIHLRMTQPGV